MTACAQCGYPQVQRDDGRTWCAVFGWHRPASHSRLFAAAIRENTAAGPQRPARYLRAVS